MNSQFTTMNMPIAIGGMAVFDYDPKLEKKMMGVDRFDKPFNLSRHIGNYLCIPRELALNTHGNDLRTYGTPVQFGLSSTNKPRNEEQKRVLVESSMLLLANRSHILQGSTGFGKTYIGCTLAGQFSFKTLVVVTKEDLLEQWRDDALKFLDLKPEDIGIIQQGRCEVKGKKFVIAMVHSLAKEKYDPDIYQAFGFVIFDEVHRMAADTFQIAAGLFYAKLRLGLSATTKRIDGKEFVFEAHIGEVRVVTKFIPVPPKILVLETPWKVPLVPRWIQGAWRTVPLPHEPGKLGAVLVDMAKNAERNWLIVELAYKAWSKGRYVLVLSDLARDKHLDLLHALALKKGIPADDMGFYVGGMTEKARDKAKIKHLVFATYGMTAEATDVPWWDTVVLATPRSNIVQSVGRILREYENKPQPIVFDLLDSDSSILRQYFVHRCKQYQSAEMHGTIVHTHV